MPAVLAVALVAVAVIGVVVADRRTAVKAKTASWISLPSRCPREKPSYSTCEKPL